MATRALPLRSGPPAGRPGLPTLRPFTRPKPTPVTPETVPEDLRGDLVISFHGLADLLVEEVERLPRMPADELALYAKTKGELFQRLEMLLREASQRALPAPPAPAPDLEAGADGMGSDEMSDEMSDEIIGDWADPDAPMPVTVDDVRAAAARLDEAVKLNSRALQAAQDAVASVAHHLARAIEKARTDGVYDRRGEAPAPRTDHLTIPQVERQL